jgi:hypothetical protein
LFHWLVGWNHYCQRQASRLANKWLEKVFLAGNEWVSRCHQRYVRKRHVAPIVCWSSSGLRVNLTRTITASMSNGAFLDNVASLTGEDRFESHIEAVVWNQQSPSRPSWDSFCFGNAIYDPDGSGCVFCAEDTCAAQGVHWPHSIQYRREGCTLGKNVPKVLRFHFTRGGARVGVANRNAWAAGWLAYLIPKPASCTFSCVLPPLVLITVAFCTRVSAVPLPLSQKTHNCPSLGTPVPPTTDNLSCHSCEKPFYDSVLLWYMYLAAAVALAFITVMAAGVGTFWERPQIRRVCAASFVAKVWYSGFLICSLLF